jgi:enoyl-CoA hydratase
MHCVFLAGGAFLDFDQDPVARVAILFGVGGVFCSGADLKALSMLTASNSQTSNILVEVDNATIPPNGAWLDMTGPMGPSRALLSKPVIAAISGYCVAGGLELACWCDLRVADLTAKFGVFCRRWGVPLIDGGTIRLPALIGFSRAMVRSSIHFQATIHNVTHKYSRGVFRRT